MRSATPPSVPATVDAHAEGVAVDVAATCAVVAVAVELRSVAVADPQAARTKISSALAAALGK